MYEILSCAKNTQLHSFPTLDVLGVGTHANDGKDSNESVCQFFPHTKMFIRTNRNWGVELLRIKDIDGIPTMAPLQKRTIDNVYCVACPKTAAEEVAVGMTSGSIRLMNLKNTTQPWTKRLESDRLTNGVIFMDFNVHDDILAAVYENGTVQVYGTKTSARFGSMAFDKHTTKVRFHPLKRFLLSVASYKGSVMLYDTQSKKIVFNQTEAHTEPCRDIAISAANADLLFTVGYDNLINIYDTRKKQPATKIRSNYPFESLDVSECGGYFAVGNLKGQIYCYDVRSLAEPLKTAKVHDSRVNSISFVPKTADKGGHHVSFDPRQVPVASEVTTVATGSISETETAVVVDSPVVRKPDRDSFMNDIDAFMQRRDSMDLARLSTSSRMSTESRGSLNMGGNNLMGYLDDISDSNFDPDQMGEAQADESFVNVNRLIKRTGGVRKQSSVDRTQKSAINLENIREEPDVDNTRALTEIQADSNVELQQQRPTSAGSSKRSSIRRSVDTEDKENQAAVAEKSSSTHDPAPKAYNSGASGGEEMTLSIQAAFRELKLEIADLRQELREEMKEHFFQNQVDRKYTAMATRSQIWMGSFNLWKESQKQLERIDEVTQTGFGLLLTNDEFTQQLMRLQRENQELKRRIAEMEQGGAKK